MKAYPMEFRRRVVALHGQGWTTAEIRQALGVSRAWVDSIKRLHAAGKPLDVKSSANRRTSLAERRGERLKARVAEHPGTTLTELKDDLGLTESIWAIWKALRALGLTLKKTTPASLAGSRGG
jgi:transposase